ncbi:methyl-accepting chemotaxis protein [Oligoflexus tunisiensis]|uniref:methyl-accepting chemotaxis protein n=1 Tax=Oligoflexus tunisiensis TaxID=708132 RepID=UPI000B2E3373|nr:methyl-accepting chemotaxis protein [Oligoflexus tunisiensis]
MKLSLTVKVLLSSLTSALLTGAVGIILYTNVGSLIDSQNWIDHTENVLDVFDESLIHIVNMETGQRGFLMTGDEKFLEPYLISKDEFDRVIIKGQELVSDNPAQVRRFERIADLKKDWLETVAADEMAARKSFDSGTTNQEEFTEYLKQAKGKKLIDKLRLEVGEGKRVEEELKEKRLLANTSKARETYGWIALGLSMSVAVGLVLLFFVTKAVSKTVNGVNELIDPLREAATQIGDASQEIAAASEDLSRSTTESAASLEQMAASMEEMSTTVRKNAETAKRSADISIRSQDDAARGKSSIQKVIRAMEAINSSNGNIMSQITESNQRISEIVKVILDIGNKTKVINEIVFQTKLLSFNASVEAARAGEHGKGFAVVAEEVGKLAQLSGNAAKEITSLLDGSVQKVESIVGETKSKVEHLVGQGRVCVEEGMQLVKDCDEVLSEIVGSVEKATQMAGEIAVASEQQSKGAQEVNLGMSQMDQVTQRNAATSEQAAGSADNLARQAATLQDVVAELIATMGQAPAGSASKSTTGRSPKNGSSRGGRSNGHNILALRRTAKTEDHSTGTAFSRRESDTKPAVGFENAPKANDSRFESAV